METVLNPVQRPSFPCTERYGETPVGSDGRLFRCFTVLFLQCTPALLWTAGDRIAVSYAVEKMRVIIIIIRRS